MNFHKVLQIKIIKLPILERNQQVAKAISLLKEGYEVVLINDEEKKYEGIIRTHDVVGKGINPTASCKTYMNKTVPSILIDEIISIEQVGNYMLEGKSRFIPVLNEQLRILGAIKDTQILEKMILKFDQFFENSLENVANWDLKTIKSSDTIGSAMAKMREFGFSRMPVLNEQSKLEGIVVNRSLLKTQIERRSTSGDFGGKEKDWHLLPVRDFVSEIETIKLNTGILEVYDRIVNSNEHTLIVDGQTRYGIITAIDLIKFLLASEKEKLDYTINIIQAPDYKIQSHAVRKTKTVLNREKRLLGTSGDVKIRFKRNMLQSKRGKYSITATVQLISDNGHNFSSEATDFGAEKALNKALDNISRIISNSKKRALDQRLKSKSLRKLTELG